MASNSVTYDVFVAHDHRDAMSAAGVADVLRSHDLTVFVDAQEISPGVSVENAIWQAMAESRALVVVLPEIFSSSWLAFELGAAKAWNKPTYAVSAYSSHKNLPSALRDIVVLPTSRVDEIAHSIIKSEFPLNDDDVEHLASVYLETGLSVDQLLLHPQERANLVDRFNKESGRQMSGEQVMWHLLRLRKQGRVPGIKKRKT